MFKQSLQGIKEVFRQKYFFAIAIISALIMGYIYYWLFIQVTSISSFFRMAQSGDFGPYSILFAVVYWLVTLATVVFFGVSLALLVWLWQHSQLRKNFGSGTSNTLGAIVGAFGSACPVCGAFLLSLVGVASGVAAFPLKGLELKFVSLGLIMGSTFFAAKKVGEAGKCADCSDVLGHKNLAPNSLPRNNPKNSQLEKIIVWVIIAIFLVNQVFISRVAAQIGLPAGGIARLFGAKSAATTVIIAPKINPDGRTTTLVEQPTITEVPANPNSGDALADAKAVMMSSGKPFYAPEDVSFDDPINAQNKWGAYEGSIRLDSEKEARYQKLISTMVCSYCCGSATRVTLIKQCGCAHAKAVRGFYRYMLQSYGDEYSDDQLIGESHRWYAIWYPKGMLEDYLLATGKESALPHTSHGGAGNDGRHGL